MAKKPNGFTTGPETRASYAHLLDKVSVNGGKPHYSCSFLIPKSDTKTVEAINKAIAAAYEDGKDRLKGTGKTVPPLSSLKSPLRDGDAEHPEREEYVGHYFINANNYNRKPSVVDMSLQPILDPDEIYSGMYCRAYCECYTFNTGVNKGIAISLEHVQKVADGERFGGGSVSVEDAFDDDFLS